MLPYPHNPNGPLGPEYPKGFGLWYTLFWVGLLLLAIYISGGN